MPNHLSQEKSPYLLQHATNPVDWYPWGPEAFAKAAAEGKPILLSIGYSTCHWCHVMESESFEDCEVAAVLNEGFVSIKVDREERPDIDAVYMNVCQAMTGSGGWPLTVLMTADQKPFFAGTYLPKHAKFGKPGLLEFLPEVLGLWKKDRDQILSAADEVAAFAAKVAAGRPGAVNRSLLRSAVGQFRQSFDSGNGGFGPAPKFPMPHNLLFLMRYFEVEHDAFARSMAEKTLTQMARGGICDQVGGGFSRYSTDGSWLVPHFEKMLYDNALLAYSYAEMFRLTKNSFFKNVGIGIFSYVLRELQSPEGGFFCGQDADSEGVEGRFYLFSRSEVLDVLGPKDGSEFCDWFGILEHGMVEGKSVPNLLGNAEFAKQTPHMALLRERMYDYRRDRSKLLTDDKVLTSWNALMISAFAKGYRVFGNEEYLAAAVRCREFVDQYLRDADGRLFVRYRDGEAAVLGQLSDYAFYSWSLLELYAANFDASCLLDAVRLAEKMVELFSDEENGGLFLYASDAEQLIGRPKEVYDGAMPSGNSAAALVFVRLFRLTGDVRWQEIAERQLSFAAGVAERYPAGYCLLLLAMLEMLYPAGEVVCCSAEDEVLRDVLEFSEASHAAVLLKRASSADVLAEVASFTAAYPVPESGVMLYFCCDGMCSAPVGSVEELRELVAKR
ncbi:thioredoxin domain-containing protein [Methanorbis furvi]|uniref:Spermatogenesis-associated protein 20-like TRX domain-containing protein n=1 Tax=Methanorbis furvi TaxID=3028299 RepID=A0AAE4MDP2_9EURY|nr:hypothetical protein [Methanocorpusculaceae archaeon Ag1]